MATPPTEQKVLIVGGGPSGMALAQALRNTGVACQVFDRDSSALAQTRGYSLLIRESIEAMRHVLPADMPDLDEHANVLRSLNVPAFFAGFDYETGDEVTRLVSPGHEDPQRRFIRANRTLLRQWLSHQIDVQWGKNFQRYEETADGVTVFFADGTSAQGTLLVGADGSRSKIRSQLLGREQATPTVVPQTLVGAEFTLSRPEYEDLFQHGNGAQACLGDGKRFLIGTKRVADDLQSADMFLMLMIQDEAAAQPGHWGQTATKPELRQYLVDQSRKLAPRLRQYIDRLADDEMVQPTLQLLEWWPQEPTLPGKRVVLCGDALHTMTPFRGAGANTAIRDALDLAQFLIKADAQGRDFASVAKPYERIAIPRGNQMTMDSNAAIKVKDTAHWFKDGTQRFQDPFVWQPITDEDYPADA